MDPEPVPQDDCVGADVGDSDSVSGDGSAAADRGWVAACEAAGFTLWHTSLAVAVPAPGCEFVFNSWGRWCALQSTWLTAYWSHVYACLCLCVHVCVCVCVCDTQITQPKLKLQGSTLLRSPQDISETMSPVFVRPRWQAIHKHTDSQLWGVEANSGAATQAGPSTTHPPPAANCVLNQLIHGNNATNNPDVLQISQTVAMLSFVLLAAPMRWSLLGSPAPSTKCHCHVPVTPRPCMRTKATRV